MKLPLLILFLALATCVSWGNSYQWKPLTPPKAEELFTFSNGQPPSINSRIKLTQADLEIFLKDGLVFYERSDVVHYLCEMNRRDIKVYDKSMDACDGVLVTQDGKVYFWKRYSPHVMRLETAETEGCYLLLLDLSASKTE